MVGGRVKKLVVDGTNITVSGDNAPKFTKGGTFATEVQQTNTGKPFAIYDEIAGALTGIEARLGHADGTLEALETAVQDDYDNGYVSALVTVADGTKYSASGGAHIVIDGAADGMVDLREGKCTFSLYPINGKWVTA